MKVVFSMTFAERLRKFREKAGYSQKALSEKIDLTPNAYNKIETRGTQPGPELLLKIAYALGCSVDDLVGYEEPHTEAAIFNTLASWGIKIEKAGLDDGEPVYHFIYEEWEASGTLPVILENFQIVQNSKNTHIDAIIKDNKARHFMAAMEFSKIE